MHELIENVLINRDAIEHRIGQVATQIAADLRTCDTMADRQINAKSEIPKDTEPGKQKLPELTLVPILTGSIIFVADLIRKLPMPMQIHLVSVVSYPGTTTVSHGAKLRNELTTLPETLSGTNVLIVDDILDSGQTLKLVKQQLVRRAPASIRTCVLLRKQHSQALKHEVDYVCFEIPDRFVVGYGLDYNGYYRNLPDIVTLRSDAMQDTVDK